jgi:hypothetical protein
MPENEPTPIDRGRHEPVTSAYPQGHPRKPVGPAGLCREVVDSA